MKTAHELMEIAVKAKRRIEEESLAKAQREAEELRLREGAQAEVVLKKFANESFRLAENGIRTVSVEVPVSDCLVVSGRVEVKGFWKRVIKLLTEQPHGYGVKTRYDENRYKCDGEWESDPRVYLDISW